MDQTTSDQNEENFPIYEIPDGGIGSLHRDGKSKFNHPMDLYRSVFLPGPVVPSYRLQLVPCGA
jgi:hypothetical protein